MRHALTRHLPYTPEQLFDLVADVDRYPQFVRWVTAMRTWNRREAEKGVTVFDAEAAVGFSIVRERFGTRVTLDRPAMTIHADLISGPFRTLVNHWRFAERHGGAVLDFEIEFEFGSRLLDKILGANFHGAAERLIAAFEDRARALYG
ncbi:MAG: type II toxin-antitoxin system RatA family toxin [Caulobacteraceae bacterium]